MTSTEERTLADKLGHFRPDESGGPIHAQIVDHLTSAIGAEKLSAGEALPPERQLATILGVSRVTLRRALETLERHGLVRRSVGRGGGTFVSEPKLQRDLTRYAGLADELRDQQVEVTARVLSAHERTASPAIAAALHLPPGAAIYEIVRVRLVKGQPVALERTNYAVGRLPGLLELPLEGSIYDAMRRRYGEAPVQAAEYLEPMVAGPDEVAALEVQAGAPLMYVERIAYDLAGEPMEFSRDVFRGDRTRMVVVSGERR